MALSRRAFCLSAASLCLVGRASGQRMTTPPSFSWTQLGSAIAIPNGDGMGSCVLNDRMYSVGGWYPTGVSHNRVFSTTDGLSWVESAVPRTWTGRHQMPVVAHKGRIHVIGGDIDSLSYEPNTHSWDGVEGSSWRVEEANFPVLNRTGHMGWSQGDYLWFYGGQTMPPMTTGPTKFFTDLWRSPDGSPGSWELVDDECPLGLRSFTTGGPPIIDGDAYFIGGGTYTTTDYAERSYRNDIMVMDASGKFRCVSPKSQMPGMMYHSIAQLNGVLLVVCGYNGVNLKTVWASFDKGRTIVRLADFPGAATHAATLQEFNGALYLWGGIATGQNAYRLDMIDESKRYYGAAPNMITNLSAEYTVYDMAQELKPGAVVASIGVFLNGSRQVRPRIGYRSAPGVIESVYRAATTSLHAGGGYRDFPVGDFVVPGPGYYAGMTVAYGAGTPDAFSGGSYSRAMKAGDVTTNPSGFSEPSDGTFPMRWTER